MFSLHPKLAEDCVVMGELRFCRVLLMNNRLFPWLILVPMRENCTELFNLSAKDYAGVSEEIRNVSEGLSTMTKAHKINVAALGNMVAQLHIHIIARYKEDAAWPQPVWNSGAVAEPYEKTALVAMQNNLKNQFGLNITKM